MAPGALTEGGFHPDDSTKNSSRLVSQASLHGETTMRWEADTLYKLDVIVLLVVALVVFMTGGDAVAGRHGGSF